jgi:uncharacterized protein (DUF58 family)
MIVPSSRLVRTAAAVALPAATVAGVYPPVAAYCWGILTAFVIVAVVDGLRGQRLVNTIHASTPASVRLIKDLPGEFAVTLENRSGIDLLLRLAATLPEGVVSETAVLEVLAPAATSSASWACRGTRRGDHPLRELHIEAKSPLGLWLARGRRAVTCVLRVYPNLRDRATAGLFLRRPGAGVRVQRQIGKGKEFDTLRQYLPGDSFEDIHWKATARRGFPVVKLFNLEHAQEVYAVIDSSRLSAREGILDNCVDAALHLAMVANRQGDRFGLVTFNSRTQAFVRARGGLDHFRLCRETIYGLRPERVSPDFRDVFTKLLTNLRRRALLVFFTSLDDALLAETFEREVPLLARRHVVLVNVVRTAAMRPLFEDEPADLDSLYAGLAGQIAWNRMTELRIALQHRGVRLFFTEPARIKAQVASEYMNVKGRQLL